MDLRVVQLTPREDASAVDLVPAIIVNNLAEVLRAVTVLPVDLVVTEAVLVEDTEGIIIRHTTPLTAVAATTSIGGEDGTSKSLSPSLFPLLPLLFYTQIQLYVRKTRTTYTPNINVHVPPRAYINVYYIHIRIYIYTRILMRVYTYIHISLYLYNMYTHAYTYTRISKDRQYSV